MFDAILVNRNFSMLWFSAMLSNFGAQLSYAAFPWLSLELTGNSVALMGLAMSAVALPNTFFILFGGVFCDAFSPVHLVRILRACQAGVIFILSIYLISGDVSFYFSVILVFLASTFSALSISAVNVLVLKTLPTEKLSQGNMMVFLSHHLAQVVAPVSAGFLLVGIRSFQFDGAMSISSYGYLYFIDSMLIVLSLLLISKIKIEYDKTAKQFDIFSEFLKGFSYVAKDNALRCSLMYVAMISLFVHGPIIASMPIIFKVKMGLTELEYGIAFGFMGFGVLLGMGLAQGINNASRYVGRIILWADLLLSLLLLGLSIFRNIWLINTVLFSIGLCSGVVMLVGMTWFQQYSRPEYVGRVMSFLMTAVVGLIPVSLAVFSYLSSLFDVFILIQVCGFMVLSTVVVGFKVFKINKIGLTLT